MREKGGKGERDEGKEGTQKVSRTSGCTPNLSLHVTWSLGLV